MTNWLDYSLLVIFSIHLAVFGRLAIIRDAVYYKFFALTFILLICTSAFKIWMPDYLLFNVSIFWYPRILAWIFTVVSFAIFIWYKLSHKTKSNSN